MTVTARAASGTPSLHDALPISATGSGNTLTQPVTTTNASGVATGTLASTLAESKTISATINAVAITQTATVVVNAGTVSASQSTVSATSPTTEDRAELKTQQEVGDASGHAVQGATV